MVESKAPTKATNIANDLVNNIKILVKLLQKKQKYNPNGAVILQVATFDNGRGRGLMEGGESVTIMAHPLQPLKQGDSVVAVSVGNNLYYVLGTF